VPFVSGRPFEPSVLQLVFGVVLAALPVSAGDASGSNVGLAGRGLPGLGCD
jgi:hypothetical protein